MEFLPDDIVWIDMDDAKETSHYVILSKLYLRQLYDSNAVYRIRSLITDIEYTSVSREIHLIYRPSDLGI